MFLRNSFKKKLILLLALFDDIFGEYFSYSAQKYRRLFGNWKKASFYTTISQLLSVGQIEKIVKDNGKVYLRLTSKTWKGLKEDIPFFKFSQKKWDGYWRLVIFDIPEKKKLLRNALRRKLVSLSLGRWQKSVYITPFSLEEEINQFLKANKLFGYSFCIKGKRLGEGDDKEIARIAFKLDKLNDQYYKFIDNDIENLNFLLQKGQLKIKHIQDIINTYLNLILKDPGLPKELLPDVWWAEEAKESFKSLILNLKI